MIDNYRLLPGALVPLVTATLAPMEFVTGVLLVLSLRLPVYLLAWTLAFGVLLFFSIAIYSALARGLKIPCGCSPMLNGHVVTRVTLTRNLILLSLLVLDLIVQRSPSL